MVTLHNPTVVEFESGAITLLPKVLEHAGIKKPLVITDAGIMQAGLLTRLLDTWPDADNIAVFSATPTNPTETAVTAATAQYHADGCDGLVALGGGSPIDLSKAVAVMATHPGPLSNYAGIAALPRIGPHTAPIIAIPTTAGTGSEVGRGALICLEDGRKRIVASPYLFPRFALCDPGLTLGLPPSLTAGTGMDALTHCIETFLSPRINPPAEAIALDGAGRAWKWLERAVHQPDNAQARWEMMMASISGGLAFPKGLGAVHSLAHPLGALTDPSLHHGTLNAVLLPVVLRFNEDHVGNKYVRLRQAFGLPPDTDLAIAVETLNQRIGMPATLREMGVKEAVAERILDGALTDHATPTNPRPVSRDDFRMLFFEALG